MSEPKWKRVLKSRLLFKPPVDKDPRLFSTQTKGIILACLGLYVSVPGFSSTIYYPGLPNITVDLNAPPIATTLTAALFILALGIVPVFWATLSDYYQVRRILLIISMAIFTAASIGEAFINNIWGLIVLRCIQSSGSSCGQSVGAAVIADCYPIEKRGAAFGKYFFGVFFGPLLGPIIGGFLIMSSITWRATFWFCFAFGTLVIGLLFFFFPETYRINEKFDAALPTTNEPKVQYDNTSTTGSLEGVLPNAKETKILENSDSAKVQMTPIVSKKKRMNPFASFYFLRYSFVFLASLISGIAFGCMFAVETIIPDLYEKHYGFTSWKTGLSYLGAGIGNLLGAVVNGLLSDRLLLRARERRGGRAVAEDRLTINLWPTCFVLIPFGILLFGWSIERGLTVWAPIVGFGIQTFGMNQVMTSTSAYLVDCMPGQGAAVSAAANFLRMLLACVFTLAANPMVAAIGPGYTSVFLAGLSYVACGCLVLLKWKGEAMRESHGFIDLK